MTAHPNVVLNWAYPILDQRPVPPDTSWWVCPDEEFARRWPLEVSRMQQAMAAQERRNKLRGTVEGT